MGVQIPRRVHSQVPEEDAVWADTTASWGSVPQVGCAEGESDRGGPYAAGSRAYVDLDPAEIGGVASGRLYQGKECHHIARVYGERKRNFVGQSFWARGYLVSTVGRDEAVIRQYIKNQEAEDHRLEQLSLWVNGHL